MSPSNRLLRISSVLVIGLLLSPSVALAQNNQFIEQLKNSALRVAQSCDYVGFVAQARDIMAAFDTDILNTLRDADGVLDVVGGIMDGLAMPVVDLASLALLGRIQSTSQEISEAERQSVAHQLQQVCEVWREAAEVAYMASLVEAGSIGILDGMRWLDGKLDQWAPPEPSEDDGLTQAFIDNYLERTAIAGNDTLQAMMYDILYRTLQTTDSLRVQLNKIQEALDAALLELWIYPDNNGRCPNGSAPEYNATVERQVCGPASPAKSEQVRARIAYLTAQTRNIQLYVDAQNLDVEAVAFMAENYRRRQEQYAKMNSLAF